MKHGKRNGERESEKERAQGLDESCSFTLAWVKEHSPTLWIRELNIHGGRLKKCSISLLHE